MSDFPWEAIYPFLELNKTICRGILGPVVGTQGNGPFSEEAFDDFLVSCGIEIRTIAGDDPPNAIVLGRRDWKTQDVDALDGGLIPPRVYSQEMVIASMAIGQDIYDIYDDLSAIDAFIPGHPALEYYWRDLYSPGEDLLSVPPHIPEEQHANADFETLTVEFAADGDWPEVGPLGELGYRVGKVRGLPRHQRQEILLRCFSIQLIPTSTWTAAYVADWGQRGSQHRWERMCRALEWSITKAQRTTGRDMSVAIAEWQADLQFLHEKRLEWLTHSY